MQQFRDNNNRTWTITINTTAIKRVRDLVDADLLEAINGSLVEQLIRDPVLLVDVVYALCKPEIDKADVTDEQFGEAMSGDAIDHATRAMLTELVDFFPSPRDRANMKKTLAAIDKSLEIARDMIEKRLESGALEKLVRETLENAGTQSGSVQGLSGLIQDHLRSES